MTPDKERLDAVLQAAEWLLRNEDEPLTEADKAEFLAWLKASPLNVREYLGVARAAVHLPGALEKHGTRRVKEGLRLSYGLFPDTNAPSAEAAERGKLTSEIAERLGLPTRDVGSAS
jgi:hypothetical protein